MQLSPEELESFVLYFKLLAEIEMEIDEDV